MPYTFLTKEFDDKTTSFRYWDSVGSTGGPGSKKNRVNFDIAFSQLEFDNQPQSQPAPASSQCRIQHRLKNRKKVVTPPQPATMSQKLIRSRFRSYEFPDMSDLISTISDMPKDAVFDLLEEIKNQI